MVSQQRFFWCWAAVAAAVKSQPTPLKQCEVACDVLDRPDCCQAPDKCDREYSLTTALGTHLFKRLDTQVTARFIKREIDEMERPLCARIVWDPDGDGIANGAHFVMIIGYEPRATPDNPWLVVLDPNEGPPLAQRMQKPTSVAPLKLQLSEFASRYKLTGIWKNTYVLA
jgi:hypothetical protein